MKSIVPFLALASLLFTGCGDEPDPVYRERMREFVQGISAYSHETNPDFIVIPQNGVELVSTTGEPDGALHYGYLDAIDGVGQEDLLYGYSRDDRATPEDETLYLQEFLDLCENNDVSVMVTDYCSTHEKMDDSYARNSLKGYISFAAPERELDVIPGYPVIVPGKNSDAIHQLDDAANFLYLINPDQYPGREQFVDALSQTSYDLLLIDLFVSGDQLTSSDLAQLRNKPQGGRRLVIAYMSIGEAEDYRYYWDPAWEDDQPDWLDGENPAWEGNYKVKYWNTSWQAIIYGSEDAYLDRILAAGFDGVYLDIIEAFEYYE